MKHISEIIEDILVEWAYRVHDGMPNPKNPLHVVQLRESMEELNLPNNVIYRVIENLLNEEQQFYARAKKSKKIVIFKDKDRWKEALKSGSHEAVDQEEAEKELAQQGEKKPETSGGMDIDKSGGFEGEADEEDREDPGVGEQKTVLRNQDHETTDSQMNLTTTEAKAQAQKKGEKGVGAGTAESRAGEAAVHYTLRELLKGRDINDITSELMEIANDKDKILNKNWAKAAVNTAQWIHDVYGNNIEEVVWDTPEGRELIGAQGHGTSSDMFIKTKDGKNIGISLKQTTAVFLLNGGYKTQHELLVESLGETLPEEEIEEFKKLTSIETYKTGFSNQLTNIRNLFLNDKNLQNLLKETVQYLKNLDDREFEKIFDSTNYRKHLDNLEDIFSKLPHNKQDEIKFVAKLLKDPEIRKKYPDLYDNLRGEEIKLTQSILNAANSNPNIVNGLKKLCLDGMHVEDILFGKSSRLDEFITLYGNKPAVELDKGVLLKIFNMQDEYEQYLSIDDEGEREEFKQQLLEKMYDKIEIDIKDGARAGEIKIKHEDGEFHLFGIKSRTKPLGTSPGLELNQTSFMGNVIKEGTIDILEWSVNRKRAFVKARIKELTEDMEDANTEQKIAIQEEIDRLESI